MLYPLFLSLLVTLASGSPRSRGEPLHRTIQAQSGIEANNVDYLSQSQPGFGFNPNYDAEARSQGATFQVNPNTLEATRYPGTANGPVPTSDNSASRSQGATFQVNPNTLEVTRLEGTLAPAGQQNVYSSANNAIPQPFPNPQAIRPKPQPQNAFQNQAPPQPAVNSAFNQQSAFPNQFTNQPNSISTTRQDTQFGGLPGRNNIPTRNAPVPGAVEMAKRLIGNPPGGALLVGSNPPLFPLEKRLISNYTKLRPVVTDTFRCNKGVIPNYVGYGYYADVANECQIFHICLPWKELYPKQFSQDVTYQFSFICPNQTVFSQDAMTCTWKSEALPCEASPELYWLNQNFFRRVPGEFGMKYAAVNEKIVPPLVYDYDDFNPPKPSQG